tara:strand:+ start:179 stop:403 length:225 start_codon:yes stop_codon:yes gene_type:complete
MRPQIVKILTLVLFLANSISLLGQSPSGSSGPPPPSNNRGPELPIDENILILVALGLIFGMYVIYKKSRINSPE